MIVYDWPRRVITEVTTIFSFPCSCMSIHLCIHAPLGSNFIYYHKRYVCHFGHGLFEQTTIQKNIKNNNNVGNDVIKNVFKAYFVNKIKKILKLVDDRQQQHHHYHGDRICLLNCFKEFTQLSLQVTTHWLRVCILCCRCGHYLYGCICLLSNLSRWSADSYWS